MGCTVCSRSLLLLHSTVGGVLWAVLCVTSAAQYCRRCTVGCTVCSRSLLLLHSTVGGVLWAVLCVVGRYFCCTVL